MENRIIVAGSGGQGILFLGKLIAYAGMKGGKEVTWFPSYGAEMRGGTANCTVIISDEMIGSPVIRNPNTLVVLNEASYNRFFERLLPGGTLLYDTALVKPQKLREDVRNIGIDASALAASMNGAKSANMVMMGAFIAVTQAFPFDAAQHALEEMTPARRKASLQGNKELMAKGFEIGEDKKG